MRTPTSLSRTPRRLLALLAAGSLAVGALANAVVAPAAQAADTDVHGLKGEYFLSSAPGADDLAELKATRLDAAVNFPDLTSAYKTLTGSSEQTAARWTGQIEAEHTEDYTFSAIGDNGFRVWIDGELVIDHWEKDWDNEQTSDVIPLVAGQRYDLKVEQFQETGGANMFLRWSSESQPKELIPDSAYYAPEGFPEFAVSSALSEDGTTIAAESATDLSGADEAALQSHLTISVDDQPYPVESVSIQDARRFSVGLDTAVFKGSTVRLGYDGDGGLVSEGAAVGPFDLPVTNGSTATLTTPWAEQVDKDNPLPEYPRPQMTRDAWENLNGQWQFAAAEADDPIPTGSVELDETITVPYAIESELSGIQRHEDHMFYKRVLTVPQDWSIGSGNRLRLNFGAVDYQASIYLNGTEVGEHTGGYLPFSVDLTDALVDGAEQELIVAVTDTTAGVQPLGKQRANPSGIFYTPTSGIWQTVWMEPVPEVAIDDVVATPDLEAGAVDVTVASDSASPTDAVTVTARIKGTDEVVGTAIGTAGAVIQVPVPDAHLWTPDDPYLYDLDVSIAGGDSVGSYFGMRSIEISDVGGVQKITLNGEPEFLLSTLDQGYWPESQYTQPTDEALKFDLEKTKDLAFNTIRKHIKVESARFYYYADTLGLMVWQDMVSGEDMPTQESRDDLVGSFHDTVDALKGWTSIIGWTVFNEGWSEWDTAETGVITDAIKEQDPSRLVNARSGLNCCNLPGDSGRGDIIDWHMYQGPGFPAPDADRAAVDGEHGGLSLVVRGHTWKGAFSPYGGYDNSADLTAGYVANTAKMIEPARTFLSGAVYTQISDVEGEVNGFYTYDRRIEKMDFEQVRAVNQQVVDAGREAGSQPPSEGMTGDAAYPFDEGEGTTAADTSGNGNDLTLQDGASWTDGREGTALAVNGDGQYASADRVVIDTSKDYTVSANVKLDRMPEDFATAVSQEGGESDRSSFFLQYGSGGFAFSTPQSRALTEVTPELGRWYNLIGVYDADEGTITLYVDGERAATESTRSFTSVGRLLVGAGQWDGDLVDFWPGAIDDVHVYGRVLSAAELTRLAAGDTSGPSLTVSGPDGDTIVPGDLVTVAGTGLPAGAELTATVTAGEATTRAASADTLRAEAEALAIDLGAVTTSADGTAEWTWTVPEDTPEGSYAVTVAQDGEVVASAGFAIASAPETPGTPGDGGGSDGAGGGSDGAGADGTGADGAGAAADGDLAVTGGTVALGVVVGAVLLLTLGGLLAARRRRRDASTPS